MRALAGLGLFLIAACGDANSLGGSASNSYPLEFDRVRIRKVESDLLIEYLKDVSRGAEKVCKLVINLEGLRPRNDMTIDGDFRARVLVQRVTLLGGDFPPVDRGQIHFAEIGLQAGDRVEGDFEVIFTTGRSLHGDFDKDLEVVDVTSTRPPASALRVCARL